LDWFGLKLELNVDMDLVLIAISLQWELNVNMKLDLNWVWNEIGIEYGLVWISIGVRVYIELMNI